MNDPDRRNVADERGLQRCRHCGHKIVKSDDGVWRTPDFADLSGYCSPRMDDERHQPEEYRR